MNDDILEVIKSNELLTMDGYDDCIIGIGYRAGNDQYVVYDTQKIINKLMNEGMSYHQAVEFHEFNQSCAWLGDKTPVFVDTFE